MHDHEACHLNRMHGRRCAARARWALSILSWVVGWAACTRAWLETAERVAAMGNAGEKKKAKANAETLLYAKIFIAVCHVRLSAAPAAAPILCSSAPRLAGQLFVAADNCLASRFRFLSCGVSHSTARCESFTTMTASMGAFLLRRPENSRAVRLTERACRWPRILYLVTLAVTVLSYLWMAGSSEHVVPITECCS